MKRYSLGEQLRAARIKKELSLYDVEKVSGVEAQYLLAMEMDQLKALPKDIQQEALEKYATSVDLDGKHLYEEQKKNERKVKEEKKQVERKEDILDTKVPMSRFSKLKREEKRKSNYIPLLILSAVSLLIICSVGYIIIRHLSNQLSPILSLQLITYQLQVELSRLEAFLRLQYRGPMLQQQLKEIN